MFILFPLVNVLFLIILYNIHRKIFYIAGFLEVLIYVVWVSYIELSFDQVTNQFLYYLSLTGVGAIIGIAAFFIAVSLNHKHLYSDHHE